MSENRVISGMRPTGNLHLGHYHGVIKNWLELQQEYDSYFFVADLHAFTTHYQDKFDLTTHTKNLVIDWLSCGVNPNQATIFVQSGVSQHSELHLLLSMITPLSWLERVPSYKDQQEKLSTKDLSTYGFLGYPLLQSADILLYKANLVPVGDDQVAHIELTREVARRFNFIYGKEDGFEEKAEIAIKKMGKKQAKLYRELRKNYQEQGDDEVLSRAQALLGEVQNISVGDKERLFGYLEGIGKTILVEPQSMLTKASKMPGLDGQKMSKSYNNTISLRDNPSEVELKVKKMPTDPARVKLTDAGEPSKCPVWQLHEVYSDDATKDYVVDGCTGAKIGCIDCKKPLIDSINQELKPIAEKVEYYQNNDNIINQIILEGNAKADEIAKQTMLEVHEAMGL
jgi:tryptophanyl-tRNA synthetase